MKQLAHLHIAKNVLCLQCLVLDFCQPQPHLSAPGFSISAPVAATRARRVLRSCLCGRRRGRGGASPVRVVATRSRRVRSRVSSWRALNLTSRETGSPSAGRWLAEEIVAQVHDGGLIVVPDRKTMVKRERTVFWPCVWLPRSRR